jgi:alanine dehydrogenase
VNSIFQDPSQPVTFITPDEVSGLRRGALVIDISCDEGMGFPFARPTSIAEPTFQVPLGKGGEVTYYGVDHTPSLLHDAASWDISVALEPYLETVMAGPRAWREDETIERAVEIRDGVVMNPQILAFQDRQEDFPHLPRSCNF